MSDKAKKIKINQKELKCLVCENDNFWEKESHVNTFTTGLFGVDFTNPNGKCVICDVCGYVHWFFPKKKT